MVYGEERRANRVRGPAGYRRRHAARFLFSALCFAMAPDIIDLFSSICIEA